MVFVYVSREIPKQMNSVAKVSGEEKETLDLALKKEKKNLLMGREGRVIQRAGRDRERVRGHLLFRQPFK